MRGTHSSEPPFSHIQVKFRSVRIVSSVWLGVTGDMLVLEEGAQHREVGPPPSITHFHPFVLVSLPKFPVVPQCPFYPLNPVSPLILAFLSKFLLSPGVSFPLQILCFPHPHFSSPNSLFPSPQSWFSPPNSHSSRQSLCSCRWYWKCFREGECPCPCGSWGAVPWGGSCSWHCSSLASGG